MHAPLPYTAQADGHSPSSCSGAERPCFYPFHLQSALSVQEAGAGSQGAPSLRPSLCCQLHPLLSCLWLYPRPAPTLPVLRPKLLLDLIGSGPVCVQFGPTQRHGAVLALAFCIEVQQRPFSGGQWPRLEGEQGWQPSTFLYRAATAGKAGVQVAGCLCAGAIGWGSTPGMAGGHKPPRVQPLPVGRRPRPRQELQGLGSFQSGVLLCVPAAWGWGEDHIGIGEPREFPWVSAGTGGFQWSWAKRQRNRCQMEEVCWSVSRVETRCSLLTLPYS